MFKAYTPAQWVSTRYGQWRLVIVVSVWRVTKWDQWGCLLWDEFHPASPVKHHLFLRDNAAKSRIRNQHHKPWIILPPKYAVVLLNLSCGACCTRTGPIECSLRASVCSAVPWRVLHGGHCSLELPPKEHQEMICLRLDRALLSVQRQDRWGAGWRQEA